MSPVFSLSLASFVRLLRTTRNRRLSRTIEEKEELVYLVLGSNLRRNLAKREREKERADNREDGMDTKNFRDYIYIYIDR